MIGRKPEGSVYRMPESSKIQRQRTKVKKSNSQKRIVGHCVGSCNKAVELSCRFIVPSVIVSMTYLVGSSCHSVKQSSNNHVVDHRFATNSNHPSAHPKLNLRLQIEQQFLEDIG